jgi:hypothetical protein
MKVRLTHPDSRRLIGLVTGDVAGAAGSGAAGSGAAGSGGGDPGAVDLYAEVATAGRTVTLSDIQGTVGDTAMAGRVALDLSGPRPRFEAEVQTGEISFDRHGAGEPAAPAEMPATPAAEADTGDAAPLALDWLRNADGRLALTMAAVGGGGYRLDRPALRAVLDGGVLTLEQLDGGLMGGQLGLTGRLAVPANGPAEGDLSLTVVRARPSGTPESAGLALGGGTLDIDLSLSATGFRRGAQPERLVGEGRAMARDGVLKGFDIAALRDRLGRAGRPAEAIEAVARGLQGGETAFTHVDGRFAVAGGMVRLDGARLLAAAGEASAEGWIDLFAGTGDVRLRIQPRGDTALPPVTLRLSGPLDRPTRSFETREVQEFFAKKR